MDVSSSSAARRQTERDVAAVFALAIGEALGLNGRELVLLRRAAEGFDTTEPTDIRRSCALRGEILAVAEVAAGMVDPSSYFADMESAGKFDSVVVGALLKVAPLIQPIRGE